MIDAASASPDERERWLTKQFGPPKQREDMMFASMPFLLVRSMMWFDKRYRAHAPRIATYHQLRFLGAHTFLARYDERLRQDGWVQVAEDRSISYDESLVKALVSVSFDKNGVIADPESNGVPRLSYEHVTELAGKIRGGEVKVREFKRSAYRGEGSEVYQVAYESEGAMLSAQTLAEALQQLARVEGLTDDEREVFIERVRRRMPQVLESGMSYEQLAMILWFAETEKESVDDAFAHTMVTFAADRFLNEYDDRLRVDGFLKESGSNRRVSPLLLASLGMSRVEVPQGTAEIPLLGYERVTSVARMMEEEGKILSPGPKKPGRNDPCPCGSGEKYKKCCAA